MSRSPSARRRGSRADVPLTKEQIVDAAYRLIDERGSEAFSMRALANELGVFPATIYWHVGDRAQLLGLVQQQWMAELEAPDDTDDWRDWATEVARRYRRNAHRAPHVARLVTTERARTMVTLQMPDAVVGKLAELGLGDQLVHAFNALLGAVQGFVVMELTASSDLSPEEHDEVRRDVTELDAEQFPHIARHREQLENRALGLRWSSFDEQPLDESFEFLMAMLLDGLEAQLTPTDD